MKPILFQKDFMKHFRFNNLIRKYDIYKPYGSFASPILTTEPYHHWQNRDVWDDSAPLAKRVRWPKRFIGAYIFAHKAFINAWKNI